MFNWQRVSSKSYIPMPCGLNIPVHQLLQGQVSISVCWVWWHLIAYFVPCWLLRRTLVAHCDQGSLHAELKPARIPERPVWVRNFIVVTVMVTELLQSDKCVSTKSHQLLIGPPLITETCHDNNFIVIGVTGGCRYDNLRYHPWRHSWDDHDDTRFSQPMSWIFIIMIEIPSAVVMCLFIAVSSYLRFLNFQIWYHFL